MNFINNFLLKIAMLPAALYRKIGVNTFQLQAILKIKLLMDNRRPLTLRSMGRQQKKETNNSSISTVLISLVMGLFFLFTFSLREMELKFVLYFSMMIFMLASILVSDFTSVLIDVRDNFIILPKPVNDRTVVLARILHISLHIFKVVVPMSLPGIVAVAIMYGLLTTIVFIVMVILCALFTLFLINLIYVFILKIVSPARFKTIISFIQIFLAIVVYGSYQFIPRYFINSDLKMSDIKYRYLIPPYWFAATIKTLSTFTASHEEMIATVLAFVFPLLSLFVMIKYLAPSFNRKISLINTVSDSAPQTTSVVKRETKKSYSERMANIFVKDKIEKTGFLFSWKIGSRSRDFYMKVYPAFGYVIVLVAIFFFRDNKVHLSDLNRLSATDLSVRTFTLWAIYFPGYILFAVIAQISFSDKYKASWLFYTTPLDEPGKIISGTFKSIIIKFYLPIALLVILISVYFFGWKLLPNLFLGFSIVISMVAINYSIGNSNLPFSLPQNMNAKSGNFMKNILRLILMAAGGFLQYFIFSFPIVVIIALILSLVANWLLIDNMKKISWQKITSSEA